MQRPAVGFLEPFPASVHKDGICATKCKGAKKQDRPEISERSRFAALLAHSLSPLPVPTGGSDFPPEPSATWRSTNSQFLITP